MIKKFEQRFCIKFCQKLNDTQLETIHKMQHVFGEDAIRTSRKK